LAAIPWAFRSVLYPHFATHRPLSSIRTINSKIWLSNSSDNLTIMAESLSFGAGNAANAGVPEKSCPLPFKEYPHLLSAKPPGSGRSSGHCL